MVLNALSIDPGRKWKRKCPGGGLMNLCWTVVSLYKRLNPKLFLLSRLERPPTLLYTHVEYGLYMSQSKKINNKKMDEQGQGYWHCSCEMTFALLTWSHRKMHT